MKVAHLILTQLLVATLEIKGSAIVSLPIKFKGSVIGALRLYHKKVWDLSERDITFLQCLSDQVGLAMTYTRLSNALQIVKEAVSGIHTVWL